LGPPPLLNTKRGWRNACHRESGEEEPCKTLQTLSHGLAWMVERQENGPRRTVPRAFQTLTHPALMPCRFQAHWIRCTEEVKVMYRRVVIVLAVLVLALGLVGCMSSGSRLGGPDAVTQDTGVTVKAPTGTVTVEVKDSTGAPIQGAKVRFLQPGPGWPRLPQNRLQRPEHGDASRDGGLGRHGRSLQHQSV